MMFTGCVKEISHFSLKIRAFDSLLLLLFNLFQFFIFSLTLKKYIFFLIVLFNFYFFNLRIFF